MPLESLVLFGFNAIESLVGHLLHRGSMSKKEAEIFIKVDARKKMNVLKCNIKDYSFSDTVKRTVSMDSAVGLSIYGAEVESDYRSRICIMEAQRYKLENLDGTIVRLGAAIRLSVKVQALSGEVRFSGLPAIAASTELKYSISEVRMNTVGILNSSLASSANLPGELNVETYQSIHGAFVKALSAFEDPNSAFDPQVLAIVHAMDEPVSSLAHRTAKYGLDCLWHGKSLTSALKEGKREGLDKDVLEGVYVQLTQKPESPSDEEKKMANAILKDIQNPGF